MFGRQNAGGGWDADSVWLSPLTSRDNCEVEKSVALVTVVKTSSHRDSEKDFHSAMQVRSFPNEADCYVFCKTVSSNVPFICTNTGLKLNHNQMEGQETMKTLLGVILAITATAAMAANENVDHYRPDQGLDIAKVISVTQTSTDCGVVPATMVYIDNQGETHRVEYQVLGTCSNT